MGEIVPSVELIEDPDFREMFGAGIPVGLTRHRLSTTMVDLAKKINVMLRDKVRARPSP
jgi:hypothetical protein